MLDAQASLMRKSFAKDCAEIKRSILHWLRVSWLTIKIRGELWSQRTCCPVRSPKEVNFHKDVVVDILPLSDSIS